MKSSRPLREIYVEIPEITWEEVGGLEEIKDRLKESVEWPLTKPELFEHFGIKPPRGIVLFGAPGTGKTLLAKAIANEAQANFISIKGPELISKWVGESGACDSRDLQESEAERPVHHLPRRIREHRIDAGEFICE